MAATVAVVVAGLLGVRPAGADTFSTANVQLLQGFAFRDRTNGESTRSGAMTTLTFNHFVDMGFADSFFFVDFYGGRFVDPEGSLTGSPTQAYGEWHPRLHLGHLLGHEGPLWIFRDLGPAAEVNASGAGFFAWLAGVGGDLALPVPFVAGVNVYYRYDRFAGSTWQISPYWTLPFSLGPLPLLATGFVDIAGTRTAAGQGGVDVMAQPQLMLDVLGLAGGAAGRLLVGIEWYVHVRPEATSQVPQALVQWTLN